MADPSQEVQRQTEGRVERTIRELAGKGNRFDLDRAMELGRELEGMREALGKLEAAVAAMRVKKPEDQERAREAFKKEITEALTALRNTLQGHERDAVFLVQGTRHELERLGALASKGPEVKPRFFGLIKTEQVEEWLRAVDRDPQAVLDALIGVTRASSDSVATEVPTEGARRDGAVAVNRGMNALARYISGSTTEERMGEIK